MVFLMFRTFGLIIISFIALIIYILHRKKKEKFIKKRQLMKKRK